MADQSATTAAATAVVAAEAAAAMGTAQGRVAYTLTYQMIKQSQGGALSFPLIGLATEAIVEGYVAYTAVVEQSKAQQSLAGKSFQMAKEQVQSAYRSAQVSLSSR